MISHAGIGLIIHSFSLIIRKVKVAFYIYYTFYISSRIITYVVLWYCRCQSTLLYCAKHVRGSSGFWKILIRQWCPLVAERIILPGMGHNVSECSPLQELHDHPEFISHQVAVVHFHHVLMVIVSHDHHLHIDTRFLQTHNMAETGFPVIPGEHFQVIRDNLHAMTTNWW